MLPTPAPADAVAGHCHPVTAAILAIAEYKCRKDWGLVGLNGHWPDGRRRAARRCLPAVHHLKATRPELLSQF